MARFNWRILAGASAGFFIMVMLSAGLSLRFLSQSQSTVGEIVSIAEKENEEGELRRYPTIRFSAESGEAHEFKTGFSTDLEVGDEVPVLYVTTHPQRARLDASFAHWTAPVILAGTALMALAFALWQYRVARRG